jgi:lysine-N-methylase
MAIEAGRCPMWRQDGLCQIQAELGHDALCKTCREFPRLRHDYGNFTELGLELSCPEAARLILNDKENLWESQVDGNEGVAEYDGEIMGILQRTRGEFLAFLATTSLSAPQFLAVLLLYAYDVQEELDGGETAILSPEQYLLNAAKLPLQGDIKSLQDFFMGLEILTDQWKDRLRNICATALWDIRTKALLRYFIQRYWLQAVSDYDIVCRAKFTVSACILIGYLGEDFIETAQLFSKEIENDPDNVEAILDGAYTARGLTDLNLLGLLF